MMQPVTNVSEAARMLDLSGWVIGLDGVREQSKQPLTLNVVSVKDSDYEIAANNLVEQWRSIGIDAQLVLADINTFQQNFLIPRNYDVLVYQLQLGADADEYVYWHSSGAKAQGLNFSNYTSPVADLALIRGRSQVNPAAREEQYKIFADAWTNDVPAIALYRTNMYSLKAGNIRAYGSWPMPSEADRYRDVINWTVNNTILNRTP
jgi:peptide/nickel transport system substrate-binding protein